MTSAALVTTSQDARDGTMSDIRDQIRAFSLSRAEGPDREIIRALYRMEDEINQRFFGRLHVLVFPWRSKRTCSVRF